MALLSDAMFDHQLWRDTNETPRPQIGGGIGRSREMWGAGGSCRMLVIDTPIYPLIVFWMLEQVSYF